MRVRQACVTCLCVALAACLLCALPVSARGAELSVYYLQCDDRWKDIPAGDLTLAESACGIATICNAAYYLTGEQLSLPEVASWAHEAGLFNAPGVPGCYRSVFAKSADVFGKRIGYTASAFQYGDVRSRELLAHLQKGGTAALHVPGHFMAAVGYDAQTGELLVIDPLPGDIGRYDRRRKGITHSGGDWLDMDTLSQGYVQVDGYVLFSRVLGEQERDAFLKIAHKASLEGLHKGI